MAFAFERGLPVQQILYLDLAAACVRFAIPGGLILAAVSAPIVAVFEKLRADFLNLPYAWKLVVFQTGLEVMMALIVGWLVTRLAQEHANAAARAEEAERLHEAERRTVRELRRLSTLRADFVSLVSHEVRTPLAAVIGSARTLEQRWRDLSPDQRDAFLALIADETDRLAALVGRGARHLADRRRHVQLHVHGRRRGGARQRDGRGGRARARRRCGSRRTCPRELPPVRGDAHGCVRC